METKFKQLQTFFVIYNKKTHKYLSDTLNMWTDDYLDLQKDLFESYKVLKFINIDNAKEVLNRWKPKKNYCIKKVSIRTTIDSEEEVI